MTRNHTGKTFNIVDFGALAGDDHINTEAIQSAIDACSSNGSGAVVVPAGRFITGTLFLKSNVHMYWENNGHLEGSISYDDYRDVPVSTEEPQFAQCLFYTDGKKITFAGEDWSTINGRGYYFEHKHLRPRLFRIENCTNIVFENITIMNSGS